MKRVLVGIALVSALSGSALAGYRARGSHDVRAELVRAADVGPRSETLPDGATIANDEAELTRMVAEPNGPAVIGLGPRVYHLDLAIRRPLVLQGVAGTVLEGTHTKTVLTIAADDVTVRNLEIRNSGGRHTAEDAGVTATGNRVKLEHVVVTECLFGIALRMCHDCLVDGTRVVGRREDPELRGDAIKLWESDRSLVRNNLVESSRDIVVWYSKHVTLEDNVVTHSRYGSHFMYAHDSIVRRSRFVENVVGVFVMYSSRVTVEDNVLAGASGPAGIGIGFKEADDVALRRNQIVANTTGAYLDQSPRTPGKTLVLEGNLIALNRVGLRLHGAEKGASFTGNDFHENASVLEVDGAGDSAGAVFSGNRFSNYEGYDLDGDGFGDVAHEERVLSGALVVVHPDLKLLSGTAAMGAVDAIAHAVPVFGATRVLSDPHPRMERIAP